MGLKAIYKYGSPPNFYRFVTRLEPWCLYFALLLILIGSAGGLFLAQNDLVDKSWDH